MLPLDCREKWCMAFYPRRIFNIEAVGFATVGLSMAVLAVHPAFRLVNAAREGYRHSSSRSRRTASLAGFFDLSHAFDGPLR